jgi:hypothetical protein
MQMEKFIMTIVSLALLVQIPLEVQLISKERVVFSPYYFIFTFDLFMIYFFLLLLKGKIYCERDYAKISQCKKCHLLLETELYNDQKGGLYHPACFRYIIHICWFSCFFYSIVFFVFKNRCGTCNSQLGLMFHWKNNVPTCGNCAGSTNTQSMSTAVSSYASCSHCSLPIKGEKIRLYAL